MDSYKSAVIENSLKIRSKRMKFFKISITTLFWIMAIIPWIFCINLYNQVGTLKAENLELNNYYQDLSLGLVDKNSDSYNSKLENKDNNDTISASSNLSSQIETDSSTNSNLNSDIQTDPDSKNAIINNSNRFTDKNVYLTFDDGPSMYTEEILDILEKNNVKATFFVIGKTDENSLELYKRIVNDGHTLGMHSYSHDYKVIFNSIEDFDKDFTKLRDLLYDTTGYLPNIYRFPGGSAILANKNQINDFINYIDSKSVTYFDWNVVNGDATGEVLSKEQLVENVVNGVEQYNNSIVLMHDTIAKKTTAHSLDELIKTLTSQGASLLALDNKVKPIQQVKIKPSVDE